MAALARPVEDSPNPDPDPEAVYDALLAHAVRCPSCRPFLDQLWKVEQLCSIGRSIAEAYAAHHLADRALRTGIASW
jgi:hypothetical protein